MRNNDDHGMYLINFFKMEPLSYQDSYISVGNFDGVHRGHRAIIKYMHWHAKPQGKPIIVVTFFPNPADFFNQGFKNFYLSTPDEKERFLCGLGVDEVLTFDFNQNFANLSPKAFLSSIKEKLGMSVLVVGRDFALGKERQGTVPVIRSIGKELGFSVEMISPINFKGTEISSTEIRQRLDEGDIRGAATLLGRYYSVSGEVTRGSDRGAKIGLPTANISHWLGKKLPAVGVYATYVVLRGEKYMGITNVGFRPTFEDQELPSVETHILDFDGNIYGETLTLQFIEKIRDEKKFSGVETLIEQIERDKATARKTFENEET
jgi:riboflavin kinase / FMN adenylyltransferase